MGEPTCPKPYAGLPSFEPLYTSARSGFEPETGTISHLPEHLASDFPADAPEREGWWSWADVLVDFRTRSGRREPLPRLLPQADKRQWPAGADGWSMTGHLITPFIHRAETGYPIPADGTSVLRIMDGTGFAVAVVVSNDKESVDKHKFAIGRLTTVLPALREHLLGWQGNRHHTREEQRRLRGSMRHAPLEAQFRLNSTGALVDLHALFAAVRDPHGWLGIERSVPVESLRFDGPYRDIPAVRALVEWSSAGATSFAQVSHLVHAGLDAAEVTRWKAMASPEHPYVTAIPEEYRTAFEWSDADIAEWYAAVGGGTKTSKFAHNSRAVGFAPQRAARWRHLLENLTFAQRQSLSDLDAAGWTPEQAEDLWLAMAAEVHIPGSHYHALTGGVPTRINLLDIAEWRGVEPEVAVAHARAGLSPQTALRLAAEGQAPQVEALEVLAALRHGRTACPGPELH